MERIVLITDFIPLNRLMRRFVSSRFVVLVCLLFVSSAVSAQEVKLTLNFNQIPLVEVLDFIESKTGYTYLVRSDDLNLNELVTIKVDHKTVTEVLAILFENSVVNYEIKGHNISIFKPQSKTAPVQAEKPIITLNGRIIDANGYPIVGASIYVKGSKCGAISKLDGTFNMKTAEGTVLTVSHLGYLPVSINIEKQNKILIILTESSSSLNEVMVVAFVLQEKQNMTSSVSQVNANDIEDIPSSNLVSALQGQTSGVNITDGSGQPGQISTVRIRGMGSLQSETNPLVIVDGIPSSLSMVGNNDVESISILKDAAACSVYGARAANGVILVTTKQGRYGKMSINYAGYAGFQQPTELFQEANAYHYANSYNTALMHDALTASTATTPANVQFDLNRKVFTQAELDGWKSGSLPSTDWRKALFSQNGFTQSHAVHVSGGTKKDGIALRNGFSFSYLQQYGNVKNTDYSRYTVRENSELKWDRFTAAVWSGMTFSRKDEPTSETVGDLENIIRAVNRQRPVDMIRTDEGAWNITATTDSRNPIRQAYEGGKRSYDDFNLLANFKVSYEFTPDVKLNFTDGLNLHNNATDAFRNRLLWYNGTITGPNSSFKSNYLDIHLLQQLDVNYKKKVGDADFSVLVGGQNEYHSYQYADAYRQDFVNNSSSSLQLGSPEGSTNSSVQYEWALVGLFGRVNLNYQKKYLLELNFREDFSSRLSQGKKSGFFPALSAGWMLSNEPFMQETKTLFSELKLRASYGILGNQNIPGATSNSMYYPGKPILISTPNVYYLFGNTLINPLTLAQDIHSSVSWERTAITDIAVDGKLWNGLITYSIGYFKKKTTDMLMIRKVSAVHGGKDYVTNLGSMKNEGFELEYSFAKINKHDFVYDISGNISYTTNKILDLGGVNLAATGVTRNVAGYPLNSYYLFKSNGLLTKEEFLTTPGNQLLTGQKWGDQKIDDVAGYNSSTPDGKIDVNDKVLMNKSATPKWFYGLSFNCSYHGFGISGMFQGAADFYRYLGGSVGYGFSNGYSISQWTIEHSYNPLTDEDNYQTRLPRLSILNTINNSYPSNRFLFNSSYVRLKNLQLYYRWTDHEFTNKLKIKSVKFYISGMNLYTLSALPMSLGVDPEMSNGISGYPMSRVLTLGVTLNF